MKSGKKYYLIAWLMAMALFNVVMFLIPDTILDTKDTIFWVIYFTITASFIGQAVCSAFYASKEKKEERFLYIPVVLISYIALLVTLLLALEALTLQFLPDWFTIIVALFVLAYYALAVFRTIAAAEMIIEVSNKVERQTDLIRTLTAKASALVQYAPEEVAKSVNKVYEVLRYSDPMSSPELVDIENVISKQLEQLSAQINQTEEYNKDSVIKAADMLCLKIKERNELCKKNKR